MESITDETVTPKIVDISLALDFKIQDSIFNIQSISVLPWISRFKIQYSIFSRYQSCHGFQDSRFNIQYSVDISLALDF